MKLIHKITLLAFGLLASVPAIAQNNLERVGLGFFPPRSRSLPSHRPSLSDMPTNPVPEFRVVNGVTNDIWRATNWFNLEGRVIDKIGDLVIVSASISGNQAGGEFALKHYPGKLVPNDKVGSTTQPIRVKYEHTSMPYQQSGRQASIIRIVDFGIPCASPYLQPTAELLAAKAERDKQIASNVMRFQQDQAANGSPSAQYDLGMRYLRGDGLAQDEKLARQWLEKSAAQDNAEAKAALQKYFK